MVQTHPSTGKIIDRVVSVEARPKGLPTVYRLYEAARDVEPEPSMTYATADALVDAVDPGDTVLITCGAGVPPDFPAGETDGPPGTVVLGRAVALALGANPVLVSEERNLPPIEAAANACGLNTLPYDQLVDRGHACSVVSYTEDASEADAAADAFFDRYDPAAVVAVEKLGPNRNDRIYSLVGDDQTDEHAKMGPLFDKAHDEGVLTVGFGDGGNEIGMAKIDDTVHEIQPRGDTVCTRIATDQLVVAGSSNLGAYGVAAMLAIMTETPAALHTPDDESRMLEHAVVNGLGDALQTRPRLAVDGMEEPGLRGAVAILNNVVDSRLTEVNREVREFEDARE